MILFIDTSDFHNLNLALVTKHSIKKFNTKIAFNENYKTNQFLQKFLRHNQVKLTELSKIVVCSGPGSFTGLRVGYAMAQGLAFALEIPTITILKKYVPDDLGQLVTLVDNNSGHLHYGAKPNITKAKKIKRAD